MQVKVVDKKSGSHRVAENNQNIALDRPSVVVLKVAPEKVARYERHGNDLTLVLKDGQKIVIQGFFARPADADSAGALPAGGENAATDDAPAQDDGRNDLVLEDDNGVAWWGQYPEQWSEFHFTEIEWSDGGFGYAPLLLGVVAAGAAIAVAAGGGKDRDGGETTRPPVATDDQGSGDEDGGAVTGNVLANDRDVLRITQFTINGTTHNAGDSVTIPGVGTFTLGSDGAYTFTPEANWHGTVPTVTYTASGDGGTDTADLVITVNPVPDLTAADDSARTDANTPVSGSVAGNDGTTSGGTLTFAKQTDPTHGSVTVNPDGTYTYTPDEDYSGSDSFTYTVTDPESGESLTRTVTITVEPAAGPVDPEPGLTAEDDSATTDENTPVSGSVAGNDSTSSGGTLTFVKETDPAHGSVTVNPDGTYTYTPDEDYRGSDSFTYTVTDPVTGESLTRTVTITVNPVEVPVDPEPGLTAEDDSAITDENTPVSGTVAGNDSTTSGGTLTFAKETDPAHGSVTVNPDGTYTYTPDEDYRGSDSFTYTVTDPISGESLTRTVTITVNPVHDLTANDDSNITDEDTPVSGTVAGNDSTTSGGTLTFAKATDPGHGSVTMNPDGTYIYTPDSNYNGIDSFTYTVNDPVSGQSLTRTVTITVNPVNDAPESSRPIADQTSVDAQTIAALDVASYFSDVDGDRLTYSVEGLPAGLVLDPTTGRITGMIHRSASQGGTGGAYEVTVTATDGHGASVSRTFTWTVTNPAPTANNDVATTDEGTPVSGNVLSGGGPGDVADRDPDGDPLSVTSFRVAGHPTPYAAGDSATITGVGTFTLGSNGAYTFTPAEYWNGTVPTVTYTIRDGEGGGASATLIITVDPVPDLTAVDDTNATDEDTPVSGSVAGNDSTTSGGTLTFAKATDPGHGSVTMNPDGTYTYTPDSNYNGIDSFTYTVNDPVSGETLIRTVTITVEPVPDLTAVDDTNITEEDTAVSGSVAGNDSTTSGGTLTFAKETDPAHGSVTMNPDGTYTYTPDEDYNGTDIFTYTVTDPASGEELIRTVTITVTPVNDDPVITGGDQTGATVEAGHLDDGTVVDGTPIASGSFIATDVDGDTLTWRVLGTPDTTYGDFAIDPATGAWTYTLNNLLPATQALNEDDTVPLTYTVEVSDGAGGIATREVAITITGTNDAPTPQPDTGAVKEAGVVDGDNTATAGILEVSNNVLVNDTDVDAGETATLTVSAVRFGGSAGVLGSALSGTYGSLVLGSDGAYTYTLDNSRAATQALKQDQSVSEVFTYTVVDTNGAIGSSTLTITVTGTNDQPTITSSAAAATGTVTEQGTANPDESNTATGTLTASDPDVEATQTWSIPGSTNGTYGTIAINAATGQWTYTLDNERAATQALNNGDTRSETFTARVTDEFGAYSEQVITVTVRGSNDDLTGDGELMVLVNEDDVLRGSFQQFVSDVDDDLVLLSVAVDADGDGVDETYDALEFYDPDDPDNPGDPVTIKDGDGNTLATLIALEDGGFTLILAPNYAGNLPVISYTMGESVGDATITQTLEVQIRKVADAPGMAVAKTLVTPEDTAVPLGLTVPTITDTGTGTVNNDYSERIGAITLTLGGAGASGVTLATGTTTLTPVGGQVTIVLTDAGDYHVTGLPAANPANGIYHLTTAEYQALRANPPAESGRNFTVTVGATSYEVDATGAIIATVPGAASTQVVTVDVQAATDGATLFINLADVSQTLAEDTAINLSQYVTPILTSSDANPGNDTDGSETYWYTVSGLPNGSIVTIDGVATTISAATPIATSEISTSATPPTITVQPPSNFSGDINGVTITLHSLDTDSDSTHTPATTSAPVTLSLHVTPVAGDVSASNATTAEDTAVAFLAGVAVTDTGSGATGSEVINSVSFTVPTGWTVTPPAPSTGWSYAAPGGVATITFDATLSESAREAVLDAFTIKPPAHSSANVTIALSITTTDSNTVDGAPSSDTQTVSRNVTITVTPVAERVDTDSDGAGGNDVRMISDHAYVIAGKEDTWFALGANYTDATNTGGGHDLLTEWSNADGDEFTYAVLTPSLESDTPSDTVIGTQFRYSADGGASWIIETYTGDAIWVNHAYLDTFQVRLPTDVSGTLTIAVQAATVDYDDDSDVATAPLDPPRASGAGVSVAVSGSATLSFIKFDPVADEVTMALNGRATGLEDTEIPLTIKTTSSDVSETFNVTISDIPAGARIIYGGVEQTVTAGSVTITNFSNTTPLSVIPPEHSNDDFTLTATAVSVDGASVSAQTAARTIAVSVTGVADDPVVVLAAPFTTTEATLDSTGNHRVALSDLIAGVSTPDLDGSETATLRITGLAEGFSITGATTVTAGDGAGRVWVVPIANLPNVFIVTPENYSGTVNFQVAGVTTENDGDSRTGSLGNVSFTVTPSPEGTIVTSATLVEDEITPLGLAIVHQNGDTDEVLGEIYIPVGYDSSNYTLYLDGVALDAAGLSIEIIGGVSHFVIPAGQASSLGALTSPHLDGDLPDLGFLYQIVDPSSDGTLPAVPDVKSGTLALTATPVTDTVDASITDIVMTGATGTTADAVVGDDATPDTATVTLTGSVTVNLHVESDDTDGSEHLIRVLIEGVPDGVTVIGASQISAHSWLLVYDGSEAQAIGAGGIDVPVEFLVGGGAGNGTSAITMTVQAKDRGNESTSPAAIASDTVGWTLVLDLGDGEPYIPPRIEQWAYNGQEGREDTAFTLASVIDAAVSTSDPLQQYTFTVTLRDLPDGSVVEGMTRTTIGGETVYSATAMVGPGGDSQAAVEALLAGITVTAPPNGNDNNSAFSFDATLTAAIVGGISIEAVTEAPVPIAPVTDPATITVTAADADEGASSLTATIDAAVTTDGVHGQIVGGNLYVQVTDSNNPGGTVTDAGGNPLSLSAVSGVSGVPDGNYYVIAVGASGGSVALTYTAPDGTVLEPGSVTFTAWARTQEDNADNVAFASATDTADIVIVNNGVSVTSDSVTGDEPAASDKSNAIELTGLSVTLNDTGGSESIRSILLSGVPVGFLLYVGSSAGDATLAAQAANAGGDGVTNTWLISADGTLPAYVAILPAPHWSGTLSSLELVVESGESSLPETRVESFPLGTVTVEAIANGLTIEPSLSFGTEGQIINLNLNASMVDAEMARAAVPDQSIETTTLHITGLGAHAAFYIGSGLVASAYDEETDTYTITGLAQNDLDQLGFVQAASELAGAVTVTAWTVESGTGGVSAPVTETLELAVTPVMSTTGNDSFIYGGLAINGRAGTDTVALRLGEDAGHDTLAALLRNIEIIDLSVPGENSITGGLSAADVEAITGSASGTLTIEGDNADKVELAADQWSTEGTAGGYVTYTGMASGVTLLIHTGIEVSYIA